MSSQRSLRTAGHGASGRQVVGPWLALPMGRRPRYTIAVGSRHVAAAGLRLYQPVTYGGLGLWIAARVVAGTGALRFLGDQRTPPLADVLARYLPDGGTLSVSVSRRGDRAVALLIGPAGGAATIAKVALDEVGRGKLENEAEGLRRAAAHLRPPLTAPGVLSQEPGVLILEAASWRARMRPWILPREVAVGLGRLHRQGASGGADGRGFGHGDVAPWNLLRTGDGWCLLDWEDSSELAPAFDDPLHYLIQSHALLGRPNSEDLLAGLRGVGWIGEVLRAYADAAEVDLSTLPDAFTAYLGRTKALLRPDRPDERRGIIARERLLAAYRAMKKP